MTTPPTNKNFVTSAPAQGTLQALKDLQTLSAAVAVVPELYEKMATALFSMGKVISPQLMETIRTLAMELYYSDFESRYWLIRDDSPVFVRRYKGWDGYTPNPYCYNCEHTLLRHSVVSNVSQSRSRASLLEHGGVAVCGIDNCTCTRYDPSFVGDDDGSEPEKKYVSPMPPF